MPKPINWSGKCRKIQNENNAIYLSFFLFHYRETFVFQHVSVSSAPTIAWSAAFICSQFDLFASLHFEWNALNNSTWPSDIDDIINKILRCLLILLRFFLSNYRASTFMWFVSSFHLVVVLFSFLIVAHKRYKCTINAMKYVSCANAKSMAIAWLEKTNTINTSKCEYHMN